jgi:hypothetical protein
MISINTETGTLVIQFPFEKDIESKPFDVIKTINVHINDNPKHLSYLTQHNLDKIINYISNGANNYPGQIKINLFVDTMFDNYELFRYFMKFIDRLTISPSISLTDKNNTCLYYLKCILSNFNVSKLVFDNFVPDIIDLIMHVNYDNIVKLVLYGSYAKLDTDKSNANKFIDFLNKFPNLKSIKTNQIYINLGTSHEHEKTIFNLEKIVTDSVYIFLYTTSQTTTLKKIYIHLGDYCPENIFSDIERVIYTNDNISYLKIITYWLNRQLLCEEMIKKLLALPLEHMDIDGWTITIADTINVVKNNTNIKHCTFTPDEDFTTASIDYYKEFKCMFVQDFVNEIPAIISANPNIEFLEFVYDNSEKNVSYLDFVIKILSKLADCDNHVQSLTFFSESYCDNQTILPTNLNVCS